MAFPMIGAFLKRTRVRKQLTLSEVASPTGLATGQLSEIESGTRYLGRHAAALEEVLGPEVALLARTEATLRALLEEVREDAGAAAYGIMRDLNPERAPKLGEAPATDADGAYLDPELAQVENFARIDWRQILHPLAVARRLRAEALGQDSHESEHLTDRDGNKVTTYPVWALVLHSAGWPEAERQESEGAPD